MRLTLRQRVSYICGVINMYTIQQLAKLANVTTRTLRYYDQIDLLKPTAFTDSGYRQYDQAAVEQLQKILFYRTFNLSLANIQIVLKDETYFKQMLEKQMENVKKQQLHLAALQQNIERTLNTLGGGMMTNEQRFEGLKIKRIKENEDRFGEELRAQYGDETIAASQQQLLAQDEATYEEMQALEQQIIDTLIEAKRQGLQSGVAKQVVGMHKKWLRYSWPTYSTAAHKGLADMYVADERFSQYYDQHGEGLAQFLREAIHTYA